MEERPRTIFINTATGDDKLDGLSPETALKSHYEYQRRLRAGAYPYPHAINISGAISIEAFKVPPNRREKRAAARKKSVRK